MSSETQTVVVAVIEPEGCRLGMACDEDLALTLIAVVSEDPAQWTDIVAYWPRYRTPVVPEFADALPLRSADLAEAFAAIDQHDSWVWIDLVQKRVLTGRGFQAVGRDQAFVMMVDERGRQRYPVSVRLPPWWELTEQTGVDAVQHRRETEWSVPKVNRQVLFGDALVDDLATRILAAVRSAPWRARRAHENERSRYEFTLQVHRDWLMTPREDLAGKYPREMLHSGRDWIDGIIWSQQLRGNDGGELVAIPTDVAGYDEGPMGTDEVVMYFDLCRELINAGWQWCIDQRIGSEESPSESQSRQWKDELRMHLNDVKVLWLGSPFEGGASPEFTIECSRRRVPHGPGISIVGIGTQPPETHELDCDCPICDMMSEGLLGPCFSGFDGHHLELDDEFAFSLRETYAEWKAEQADFAARSAEFDRRQAERESADEQQHEQQSDDWASVWSGEIHDGPLPGDSRGHLKLAFLLAEIVGILQASDARDEIRRLNEVFRQFRHAEREHVSRAGRDLSDHLEGLAERHPKLLSRAADLQSRIAELLRNPELIEGD